MEKSLNNIIYEYQKGNSDLFISILSYFNNSINFYTRKLDYYCAETDLIIFLIKLIRKIELDDFKSVEELEFYIKKSIKREYIYLSKKNTKNNFMIFNTYITEIELSHKDCSKKQSDLIFNDLIQNLTLRQRKIIQMKYKLGFTDSIIAQKLSLSRQTIHKERIKSLERIKNQIN